MYSVRIIRQRQNDYIYIISNLRSYTNTWGYGTMLEPFWLKWPNNVSTFFIKINSESQLYSLKTLLLNHLNLKRKKENLKNKLNNDELSNGNIVKGISCVCLIFSILSISVVL